jgi:Ca2+-binding RTX toxin-like protein
MSLSSRRRTNRGLAVIGMCGVTQSLESRILLSVSPPPANFVTMINNGPASNRVDVIFLGDGYTTTEINSIYPVHIQSAVDHFFNGSEDPFLRYRNFFNIHRMDVISVESGIDDPSEGVFRNSALGASYDWAGIDRLVYVEEVLANSFLSTAPVVADMRLVTVNSTQYGGGGGYYAVYAGGNSSSAEIALHEVGHSFGDLADEYYTPGTTYTGAEPTRVNVTKSSSGAKWSEWLGYDQPGIGVIGAYEGGMYSERGIYRPSLSSKMKASGQPFDAVSRQKLILDIYALVDPTDGHLATSSTLSAQSMLWANVVDPSVIQSRWFVDGVRVVGADDPFFIPSQHGVTSGQHTIRLETVDTTDWVRRGQEQLAQSFQWTVNATTQSAGLVFSNSDTAQNLVEGTTGSYGVALSTAPTSSVTVQLNANNQIQCSPATLTFTPANWNIPQTIQVTAIADSSLEGIQVGRITHSLSSSDARYHLLTTANLISTVQDHIDTVGPTATIAFSDTALKIGDTAIVTISFNEVVTGFTNSDFLLIENGTLTTLTSANGGLTYTATFAPNMTVTDSANLLRVNLAGVTDIAGNAGSGTVNSPNYSIDTTRPSATIALAKTTLQAGETTLVTFQFSEAVTGFSNSDVTVQNGTLSTVSSTNGGGTWTGLLTAANVSDETNVITLNNTGVNDLSGNAGNGSTVSANYVIDLYAHGVVQLIADPDAPGLLMLLISGTSTSDVMSVAKAKGVTGGYVVTLNGVRSPVLVPSSRIYALGRVGNDKITIGKSIPIATFLDGGIGDDTLTGSSGPDVIYGGDGADTISGSTGNNLMFGQNGADKITGSGVLVGGNDNDTLTPTSSRSISIGGSGSDIVKSASKKGDILIGGTTNFDTNPNALRSIYTEWSSSTPAQTRIDHLTGLLSGGLNGGFFLISDTVRAGTIHDDGVADTLTNAFIDDWLLPFPFDIRTRIIGRVNHL